jgi:hypothetical protein
MRSTKKLSANISVSEMSLLIESDRDAANRALVRRVKRALALQNSLCRQSAAAVGRCCGLPPPPFLY